MVIEVTGDCKYFHPPFRYEGLKVRPANLDREKTYTVNDFPYLDFTSVSKGFNDLYLELTEPGYFNVMHVADILSRMDDFEEVRFGVIDIAPPLWLWNISDKTIADFVDEQKEYSKTTIIGLSPDEVSVSTYFGLSIDIMMIEEL